jgi:hypothetical protein
MRQDNERRRELTKTMDEDDCTAMMNEGRRVNKQEKTKDGVVERNE